jgi:hypothetical protein
VEQFDVFRWVLIFLITPSLAWPLTIPLAALAYKVRLGLAPIPMDFDVFWLRCTGGSLGLGLMALLLCGLDYAAAVGAGVPAGIVHIVLLMLYLPAATWFVFWIFAFEELLEGFSMLVIFHLIPGLLLALLVWLVGLFDYDLLLIPAEWWIVPVTS